MYHQANVRPHLAYPNSFSCLMSLKNGRFKAVLLFCVVW